MGKRTYETEVAGRPLRVEIGEVARQANGSALIYYGETTVLVTATASREPREGVDFFPLRVDYEERQYAAGRIPGSFFRREGRPSDDSILACRLTDRPLRPLFPKGFRNDVQIINTILSYDPDSLPEFIGIFGASLTLSISDIPFDGPIAAANVGLQAGELILNPSESVRQEGDLDLWVAGGSEAVTMVEAGAREVPEDQVLDAIFFGHRAVQKLVDFQQGIMADYPVTKMDVPAAQVDEQLQEAVRRLAADPLVKALHTEEKLAREEALHQVRAQVTETIQAQRDDADAKAVDKIMDELEKEEMRRSIVEDGVRADGRAPDELRSVSCRVGMLPRAHGSGLFTRGQTQALTVTALGPVGDRQLLDTLGHDSDLKRYLHHYNFSPYSVGETWPLRSPGRREIGHGALAERALRPMLPHEDDFPYTIRLVSEILESNGSTSMASVCGSSLALMDAGVPIKKAVGGIAMGLVKERDQLAVLTDIQGMEDFLGDMDFKVAGTRDGVTAVQMDIKLKGIERDVLQEALEKAHRARMTILDHMDDAIAEPRPELSPHAPRIFTMKIDPDKIRDVIGSGGKTINKIIAESGAEIDIEDDGRIFIAAVDGAGGEKAREMIEEITREIEVGEVFVGKVVRIVNFGAFVELVPGKDGLVHISELTEGRVPSVKDCVSVGDRVLVKVKEIDDQNRINLSRRLALRDDPDGEAKESREGHD